MVRLGAATHTIDNDNRRFPLKIEQNLGNNKAIVRIPSNSNVALPGVYWLFAMNSQGVPSEGVTVIVVNTGNL